VSAYDRSDDARSCPGQASARSLSVRHGTAREREPGPRATRHWSWI